MRKAILMLSILLLSFVSAESFPNQNSNSGFVGWSYYDTEAFDFRISYPSVEDGEDSNMARNGPFAIVVFIVDDGESIDQYEWLQTGLSKYGYITLVVDDRLESWSDVQGTLEKMNNGTLDFILDSIGMFSLEHVSVSGHGTGGLMAAEFYKSSDYQIDGLFALGLDGSESDYDSTNLLSRPSSALFLTGTADKIAPAGENVMPYLSNWPGAWQIMHVRGANHIGYQESDTFLERFVDGESTLGRQGQQNQALNHILPYLNLSLRGDDSAYQQAFNREDKTVSSDSDSYIDENLSRSRLYNMTNVQISNSEVILNQTFTVSSDVEMRNGLSAEGNVSCVLENEEIIAGSLQSGVASCLINSSYLPIGVSTIEIQISDYSFSDWSEVTVNRIGTPMELTTPTPEIEFDQHGSITIFPSDFAIDPDGKEILFLQASFENQTDIVAVNNSGFELELIHQNQQEWDGTLIMNLSLIAGNNDYANITTNVTILPVNDPVFQTETIPQQQTVEDGDSIVIQMSDYVSDPENQQIYVEQQRDYEGITIITDKSDVIIAPQTHWFGAEIVTLLVWDNVTEKIEVNVPILVQGVDDPIIVIEDEVSLDIEEDESIVIDLSVYAIDVDDDLIAYQLSDYSEDIVTYNLNENFLRISSIDDLYGSTSFTINVSDNSSSESINFSIEISSVPDPPLASISSVDFSNNVLSVLWTISDVDGDAGHVRSVTLAGEEIGQNTECNGENYITCLTTYRITNQSDGVYRIEVQVWDGQAQLWSNIDFMQIEINKEIIESTKAEESLLDSSILQVISIVIILLLILGYGIQSRKE